MFLRDRPIKKILSIFKAIKVKESPGYTVENASPSPCSQHTEPGSPASQAPSASEVGSGPGDRYPISDLSMVNEAARQPKLKSFPKSKISILCFYILQSKPLLYSKYWLAVFCLFWPVPLG